MMTNPITGREIGLFLRLSEDSGSMREASGLCMLPVLGTCCGINTVKEHKPSRA